MNGEGIIIILVLSVFGVIAICAVFSILRERSMERRKCNCYPYRVVSADDGAFWVQKYDPRQHEWKFYWSHETKDEAVSHYYDLMSNVVANRIIHLESADLDIIRTRSQHVVEVEKHTPDMCHLKDMLRTIDVQGITSKSIEYVLSDKFFDLHPATTKYIDR